MLIASLLIFLVNCDVFPSCRLWLLLISLGYRCESYSLSLDNMIVTTAVPAWLCCPAILLLPVIYPQ